MTRAAIRKAIHSLALTFLAAFHAFPPSAVAQSQPASATTQDTFHIHGIVLDDRTGKPIARAVVEASNGRLAAFTDRDGRFALTLHFTPSGNGAMVPFQRSLISAGALFLGLTARKPGYFQDNTQRQLQQIALSALESDLVVRLTPQSAIQGRVATAADDHPEGLRIALFSRRIQEGLPVWGQTAMVTTDSRGEFRFAGLQPGRYRLVTQDWSDDPAQPAPLLDPAKSVSRYAPTSYPDIASGPDPEGSAIRLTAGQVGEVNFNLHPQTYFPVRIPVVLPAGSNPGLQSRVQRPGSIEGVQSGFSLRYNAREKVVEGVLPSGSYEIALQTNGPTASAATVQLTVGGSRTETAPITLQPLASIPVILHLDLTRTTQSGSSAGTSVAPIAGRVQGGVVAGIAGHGDFSASPVQVLLVPPPGSGQTVISHRREASGGSGDSGDSGEIVLDQVAPGAYRVEANAPGGYIAAANSGGTDLLRLPLVVAAGSGVEPIEITVRDDTATLHGTLDSALLNASSSDTASTASGFDNLPYNPSNIFLVTCIPTQPSGRRLLQVIVRRDGSFVINGLPPGSYRVYASRVPLETLEYRSESFTREYGGKGQPITLEPNGTATVTLTSVIEKIEELKDP